VGAGGGISGSYDLAEGEVASTVDPTELYDSVIATWAEAMESRENTTTLAVPEIGGLTFTPGTWRSESLIVKAGANVTLDGQGDANARFLFQSNTTMLSGADVNIVLINGAKAENVVWAVGTTFTTGTMNDFKGAILAGTTVTIGADTVVEGSILAGTAITFGADIVIDGSVVAGSAITFGTGNEVHDCVVAVTAITFGAGTSVEHGVDSVSPSNSPTASPSATPGTTAPTGCPAESPSSSPSSSSSSSPKTSAMETLENECPEDIELFAVTGITEYGDVPPIHILSQDQYTVTFQVVQNVFAGSVSYMYTQYHTVPNGDTGCLANAYVTQSDTLIFTAECMHTTPLSVVDLWVVDVALDANLDNAKIPEWCHPPKDTVLPTVQYTFQLHCVSQCVPTSVGTEIVSRARTLLGKDMALFFKFYAVCIVTISLI
jgi:hypothetical protein